MSGQDGSMSDDGLAGLSSLLTNDTDPITSQVDYRSAPCFTKGTQNTTPNGQVAIEDLCEVVLVCTLDHGVQRI